MMRRDRDQASSPPAGDPTGNHVLTGDGPPLRTGGSDSPGVAAVATDELPPGGTVLLPPGRTGWTAAISVFRDGDEFFALDDTCTHAEASLSEGYVEDGCVECPLHGALFRLTDGAALTLPATRPVRAHRVAVVDAVVRLWPGEAPAAG